MKYPFTLCVLSVIACLGMTYSAHAKSIELKTAAVSGMFPRYYIKDIEGEKAVAGLCIDILKRIDEKAPEFHFTWSTDLYPWSRLKKYLDANKIQVQCGVSKNPERENLYQFPDTPLYPIKFVIFASANDEKARKINTLEEMKEHGGSVLALRGAATTELFRKQSSHLSMSIEETSSLELNIRKLIAGRGSFLLHNDIDGIGTIKKMGHQKDIILLPIVINEAYHWLPFSKKVPKEIVQKANGVLQELQESGELQLLYDNYMKQSF